MATLGQLAAQVLGPGTFGVGCFYLMRPLANPWLRGALASVGCVALTSAICKDRAPGMATVMAISLSWMSSIRLMHLVMMPEEERLKLTLPECVKKFVWFLLPLSENPQPRQRKEWIKHLAYLVSIGLGSIVVEDWLYRWLSFSLDQVGGPEVVRQSWRLTIEYSAIWGALALVGIGKNNLYVALVSLLSQDRYQLLEFCKWPVISASPREFWGRRYNLLVQNLLHESVFTPLRTQAKWSTSAAAMAAFILSGALHAHVAVSGLGQPLVSGSFSAITFFVLHGLACLIDSRLKIDQRLPKPVAIGLTQGFLLATTPFYPAFFIYSFGLWFPPGYSPVQLPIPSFYPK